MCMACSEVYTAYQTMEAGIRSLLVCKPVSLLAQPSSQQASKSIPELDFLG